MSLATQGLFFKLRMIIGIGGCSNSGKSALAIDLKQYYSDKNVKIFCQDDFVKRRDFLTKINDHIDWEVPSSIKIEEYITAVKEAERQYDMVICEGLFAFWFEKLNQLYHKRIFINIDKATFISRKKADFRWGHEPNWYIEHIWESYLKYGRTSKLKAFVFEINAVEKHNSNSVKGFINT